ncbi:MAG TPA: threonine/serine exporter family protein, partial [Gemmatimonadales bacterium]
MSNPTNLPPGSGTGKSGNWRAADPRVAFVLRLGRALHGSGEPTPRIEDTLEEMATRLDLQAQFFVTPTSIFAAFGPEETQHTHLIRTSPSGTNLGKLSRVDGIARQVLRGGLTPAEGMARLDAIENEPPLMHPWFRVLGSALASACAGRFVGGGLREMGVAAAAGTALGLLSILAARREALARLYEPISAFVAAIIVSVGAFALDGISYPRAVLASLVVLFPGMVLTTAMQELTVGHLTSGTTRLFSAVTTFLSIGFGFAFAAELVSQIAGAPPLLAVDRLPRWTEWVAL